MFLHTTSVGTANLDGMSPFTVESNTLATIKSHIGCPPVSEWP